MKALGMIEVYGYLAAVEALDSALKAANVSLTDVVRVKGGLVTVLVNGEVGAVKAAMDASAAAAERVGTVVSVHVIPRPAEDVMRMLSGKDPDKRPPSPGAPVTVKTDEASQSRQSIQDTKETLAGRTISADDSDQEEDLTKMTVAMLRTLAREIGLTSMTRQEIRFARKQDLISAIIEWKRQES